MKVIGGWEKSLGSSLPLSLSCGLVGRERLSMLEAGCQKSEKPRQGSKEIPASLSGLVGLRRSSWVLVGCSTGFPTTSQTCGASSGLDRVRGALSRLSAASSGLSGARHGLVERSGDSEVTLSLLPISLLEPDALALSILLSFSFIHWVRVTSFGFKMREKNQNPTSNVGRLSKTKYRPIFR